MAPPSVSPNYDNDCAESQPSSEGLYSQQTSKKGISFSLDVRSEIVKPRTQYTIVEWEATWVGKAELERIHRVNGYTVFMIENGKKLDERKYCPRGLEGETERGKMEQKAVIETAVKTVLQEQANQRRIGISDPESIATSCCNISSKSIAEAYARGVDDQRAAGGMLDPAKE